jgi:hypothetical protein
MINYVTIRKFSELTGYSEQAVCAKIRDGTWLQGQVFCKAPDGRILISVEGFKLWVEAGQAFPKRQQIRIKSPSPIKGSLTANKSTSSPPPFVP